MKFFNTAGPVSRPNHYKVDPLRRWSLYEVLSLTDQEKYFILNTPRQTHLDQLADKMKEDRVRRFILPMILGEDIEHKKDDTDYCIDLGLIKRTKEGLKTSNSIYWEVVPRELTEISQDMLPSKLRPDWLNADESLNINTLLILLKDFWNDRHSYSYL